MSEEHIGTSDAAGKPADVESVGGPNAIPGGIVRKQWHEPEGNVIRLANVVHPRPARPPTRRVRER